MAWSDGTYTRTNGTYTGSLVWTQDAAASIDILANRHDTHDQDLASGINSTLHKGGQNSPTAHIDWGGFKITGLGNGTAATDAATYGQTITAFAFDAPTRVLTGTRAAGNLTLTIPIFTTAASGLVPAGGSGGFLRYDGVFAAPGASGILQWTTVAANGTAAAGVPERAAATVTRTLPATIAVNDFFVFAAAGGAITVSTPHTIKRGATTHASPGDTITVARGETLYLLANSSTELGII